MENLIFKTIDKDDYPFLKEMLYESLFVPEGGKPYPKSIVDTPEISKYIDDWDNDADFGLIAQYGDNLIGAVWGRVFTDDKKGYGFIDRHTSEIGMALKRGFRNRGVGTCLLSEFFKLAVEKGYKALSLSVDKQNRAREFYRRMGFVVVDEAETAYTMRIGL